MQKPSDPAAVRGDRNISIVLILENSVQDQFGAPPQVFLCFTLRSKHNVILLESLLEDKVGELGFYRRSCTTLVATVPTIVFTGVLEYGGFQVRRKDALKSEFQRTESSR